MFMNENIVNNELLTNIAHLITTEVYKINRRGEKCYCVATSVKIHTLRTVYNIQIPNDTVEIYNFH